MVDLQLVDACRLMYPGYPFGPNLQVRAREWLEREHPERGQVPVVIADSLAKLLLEVYLKGEADERSVWQENVPDIEALRKLARVAEDVAVIANTSPDALAALPPLEAKALRNLLTAVREWKAARSGPT